MSYGNYGMPASGIILSPDAGPVPPVPLQQPQNLFRFGEQTIWSSLNFNGATALASTTNRLFSVPIGSTGQGFGNALSIAETNLKEGGRVPSGVAYDVFGISTEISMGNQISDTTADLYQGLPIDTAAEIADLTNILHNGVLSWDFTQTVVDICPVILAGTGGGAFGAIAQNAAGANSGNMNNGNGSIWMYRKHPVALPGNTTFSVVLRFGSRAAPVGTNAVNVRLTLLGYYKNVIEIG